MITERTLKRWRRDALVTQHSLRTDPKTADVFKTIYQLHERILRLTQELLDQHLLRKE